MKITDGQRSAFLADIEGVCRSHGLSLLHEDTHGAFTIEPFSENGLSWLKDAYVEREYREEAKS